MNQQRVTLGFRVTGSPAEPRKLVDHAAAFQAYAAANPRCELERESYLSLFVFPDEFASYLRQTGSPRGYAGPCWSDRIWFDIDRQTSPEAAEAARRLAVFVAGRWGLDEADPLLFFSGSKGFHLAFPLSRCGSPPPSSMFALATKALAERLAELAGVRIDASIYDKQRIFRAPNSTHPKTGLRKRFLLFGELLNVSPQGLLRRAAGPVEFELPAEPPPHPVGILDWNQAVESLVSRARERAERQAAASCGPARLNRSTLAFLREGAREGERHRALYAAAANLSEFHCPPELAHALLSEPARDCGLAPSDARRTIDCGLRAAHTKGERNE